jgi:transcriptional regulator with XRE-family HTH domain
MLKIVNNLMMTFPETLGVVLRRLRNKQNMAQIDLAAAADCERSFISAIENGKTGLSIDLFLRLCDALDAQPWDVLKDAIQGQKKK